MPSSCHPPPSRPQVLDVPAPEAGALWRRCRAWRLGNRCVHMFQLAGLQAGGTRSGSLCSQPSPTPACSRPPQWFNQTWPHAMTRTGADGRPRLPVPLMLSFGAVAGLVAQTATYPFDVVRRQMQVRAADGTWGWWQARPQLGLQPCWASRPAIHQCGTAQAGCAVQPAQFIAPASPPLASTHLQPARWRG